MDELIHVDLFSGAGGFSAGLRPCGYRTAVAVEIGRDAARTFRSNHPGTPVIERDVRSVTGGEVAECLPMEGFRRREVDLLTAGVPCQSFSSANTRRSACFDHRQTLFREVIRIARAVRARVVLLENVPGIRTKAVDRDDETPVADLIRRELAEAGYVHQAEGVLVASRFGVPQDRERWFLLAGREPGVALRLPEPTGPRVSVSEAFAGLPDDPGPGGYGPGTSPYAELMRDADWWRLPRRPDRPTHHETYAHPPGTVARYAMVRPGRRVADLVKGLGSETLARLQLHDVLPRVGYTQSGTRLRRDRPGFTVTGNVANHMVHFRRNRAVTVREAARLQSFPDGFEFAGGLDARFLQVGNAVPPLLAFHLGLAVREALTGGTGGVRVPHLTGRGEEVQGTPGGMKPCDR